MNPAQALRFKLPAGRRFLNLQPTPCWHWPLVVRHSLIGEKTPCRTRRSLTRNSLHNGNHPPTSSWNQSPKSPGLRLQGKSGESSHAKPQAVPVCVSCIDPGQLEHAFGFRARVRVRKEQRRGRADCQVPPRNFPLRPRGGEGSGMRGPKKQQMPQILISSSGGG